MIQAAATLPADRHDLEEMLDVILDIYGDITKQDVLDYMEAAQALANE